MGTSQPVDIAAGLGRSIGPLRRAILRSTRVAGGLLDLSEAQIQVLRALAARSPQGSGELATELHLARPTVSNVVGALTAAGYVTRVPGVGDQRRVLLAPTPLALRMLDRYDATSRRLLDEIIDDLSADQRATLAAAIAVLDIVTARLEGRVAQANQPPDPSA
ncbi:MarR family winged helix-turn-helix transcriptional regulator [Williamsia sp. CHRR-6]|uniref:MarR family winged helix-turn-helix transcriptional regulator n=1 Tax=Williamsia sp. CHRR-6 TaxID=2835871 RepID=UPI001BD977B9|nr:MarR family transcriptional regulator [Williamsia sp. CHRR-6]MBT0566119.1 MarR family transcriptional regulator [Williamsia sp. CHRR-6]